MSDVRVGGQLEHQPGQGLVVGALAFDFLVVPGTTPFIWGMSRGEGR